MLCCHCNQILAENLCNLSVVILKSVSKLFGKMFQNNLLKKVHTNSLVCSPWILNLVIVSALSEGKA